MAGSDVIGLLCHGAADAELTLAPLRLVVHVRESVLVHGNVVPAR